MTTDGTATVHFVSQDGHEATKTFPGTTFASSSHANPLNATYRRQPPGGSARHSASRPGHRTLGRDARQHGVEPGDTRLFRAAIDQRSTQRPPASPPNSRLADPHRRRATARPDGAGVWDDAVSTIARYQLTADRQPPAAALRRLEPLAASLDQTRTGSIPPTASPRRRPWSAHSPNDQPPAPTRRSSSAPADCRHFIDEFQSGQLTLDDTQNSSKAALTQQDAPAWIVEHWPHIVEYHELNAVPGAQITPALQRDGDARHPRLVVACTANFRPALDRHFGTVDLTVCPA